MGRIRTLIVDDEPLARRRMRRMLSAETDIDVVGEFPNGQMAVDYLREQEIDLMFLDIQMPQMDGFGVLESLEKERLPVVVFVTAHDEYALRAFDVHAIDYLLKPFDDARFAKTLERARQHMARERSNGTQDEINALLHEIRRNRRNQVRFPIRSNNRVFFIRMEEIDWVAAEDNYVCLHVGSESHLLRETMNSIEGRLDGDQFVRIHRSTIVNIDRIKELRPWFHGEYLVMLQDGTELSLSRGYRERLLGFLKA